MGLIPLNDGGRYFSNVSLDFSPVCYPTQRLLTSTPLCSKKFSFKWLFCLFICICTYKCYTYICNVIYNNIIYFIYILYMYKTTMKLKAICLEPDTCELCMNHP